MLNTSIGSLPAVVRSSTNWFLGGAQNGSCCAIAAFSYGTGAWPATIPISGDWNADAVDTIGHETGPTWTLTNSNATRTTDVTPYQFGLASDLPLGWHP